MHFVCNVQRSAVELDNKDFFLNNLLIKAQRKQSQNIL